MRLRVPELLKARGWTAYRLYVESGRRISRSAAYRLERGDYDHLPTDVLDILCDVFGITETQLHPLLTREPQPDLGERPRGRRKASDGAGAATATKKRRKAQ